MATDRQNLHRQIQKLTAEKDAIDAYFLRRLTENKAVSGQYKGHQVVVLAPWSRITLDSKRLRVEKPVIWSEYARENSGVRPAYMP
jgi:predicted phage-related endonuclease